MGISEKTVEKHLAKGMRLLADRLYGGDVDDGAAAPARTDRDDERQQAD